MNSSDYNSSHRAFVQAFFSRGTMTYDEAKPVLASILTAHENRARLPNDITLEDFQIHLHTINAALSPFDYEIRSMHAQSAPSRAHDTAVYALVNATSDPQTQLATTHSPVEIAFVKRVLDAMFDAHNTPAREVMAVRRTEALRLAKAQQESHEGEEALTQAQIAAQGLKMDQAEKVLLELVDEGWMELAGEDEFVTLSPRALMELRGWLVETYNDTLEPEEGEWQGIKVCEGCKQIITDGQRCSRQACLCRLHDFCVTTFFRGQPARKCPMCETEWRGDAFVGIRAAGRNPGANRRSTNSRR